MLEFVNESIKMGEIENLMTGKEKIQFTTSKWFNQIESFKGD
jgi:hypothetical protein